MAEILSRSEVELLLSAMTPAAAHDERTVPNTGTPPEDLLRESAPVREPSSELARAAVTFSEGFRIAFQESLARGLGAACQLRRQMPRRESLRQFLEQSVTDPVWLILEAEQSSGDLVLAFDRGFGTQLLQCLLGGEAQLSPEQLQQPWSELDWRLLKRIAKEACGLLSPRIRWQLSAVESANALSHFTSWNEQSAWWVETWECRLQDLRGIVRFGTPWEFISRRLLSPQEESVVSLRTTSPEGGSSDSRELVARIAEAEISAEKLRELKVGDLIVTDQSPDSPAVVLIDGLPAWTGQAGLKAGQRAIRLDSPIGENAQRDVG